MSRGVRLALIVILVAAPTTAIAVGTAKGAVRAPFKSIGTRVRQTLHGFELRLEAASELPFEKTVSYQRRLARQQFIEAVAGSPSAAILRRAIPRNRISIVGQLFRRELRHPAVLRLADTVRLNGVEHVVLLSRDGEALVAPASQDQGRGTVFPEVKDYFLEGGDARGLLDNIVKTAGYPSTLTDRIRLLPEEKTLLQAILLGPG